MKKQAFVFTTLLAANASAFAYESTYERIQWEQRGTDTQYCLDITDANGNIAYGLQAIACGEGLHSYSAASLNLAAGNYQWKVWSPNGYGQTGFEGAFQVGAANSPLAVGSQLYANNCAACHGNDPRALAVQAFHALQTLWPPAMPSMATVAAWAI